MRRSDGRPYKEREDAIKAIEEAFDLGDCYCDRYGIRGAIQCIPSAEKQGEWITDIYKLGKERHRCSGCGTGSVENSNFCPNCGAQMKGADNE